MDTYNTDIKRVKDLELVQIGHHSSLTSSSHSSDNEPLISAIRFVDQVNPRTAIISAAPDAGQKLRLPRYDTVAKYLKGTRLNDKPNHSLNCWWINPAVYDEEGKKRKLLSPEIPEYGSKDLTKHIYSTGMVGPIDVERKDADVR